jgi:hypothetical protein
LNQRRFEIGVNNDLEDDVYTLADIPGTRIKFTTRGGIVVAIDADADGMLTGAECLGAEKTDKDCKEAVNPCAHGLTPLLT